MTTTASMPHFTDDEQDLRKTVQRFVARHCPPGAWDQLDQAHQYPHELMKSIGEVGWTGITFPAEFGGTKHDRWATACGVVTEELGKVSYSLASNYFKVAGYGETILAYGTDEQKDRWIPGLVAGDVLLALALTEPEAGSDAASTRTRAVRDGGDFVINGEKIFSTCSGIADRVLLVARTDTESKHNGLTVFLLDPKSPGLTFTEINKLGIWTNPTYNIHLDDVRVPESDVLGTVNDGWNVVRHSLDLERFALACAYVGASQAALDYAADYARKREQFGRTLSSFQVLRHRMVDMHIAIDGARLFTYRVGELLNAHLPCSMEASIAKLTASEAYMKVSSDGLQILGGMGYTMDTPMQRHFRDAKLGEIGGGSSEIQRNIIAKQLGL
jgi:alkylation response protein AidB-like acyl-CoA dehydrogenase